MTYNVLYNYEKWSLGKEPKNHLSLKDTFEPFCGRKNLSWMGGELEFRSGKMYSHGVFIPEKTICKDCLTHAIIEEDLEKVGI